MELVEGKGISETGLITRSRFNRGEYTYGITDGKDITEFTSKKILNPGEIVRIKGTVVNAYGFMQIKAEGIEALSGDEAKEAFKAIEKNAENSSKARDLETLCRDEMMEKLKPALARITKKLLAAQKLGRYIIIRFHGDGDGIAGALAVREFLKGTYHQQNSAVYSVKDAMADLNSCQHQNRPLVVMIDFGSGEGSEGGMELLKAGGVEAVMIDHHPHSEKVVQSASLTVNPWEIEYGEGSSRYTAGYLACEIARLAGVDAEGLAKTAVSSDKSDILGVGEKEREKAIVLNFSATYSTYGNNLDFYSSILENEELFHSILNQAREKMEEILRVSSRWLKKKEIGELEVYQINLEAIVKRFEFPSYGKSTTMIFEAIKTDRPMILIGFGGRSVIFRLNDMAVEMGLDARNIIEKIKETMADFVEGGGGHTRAAAIRVREGYEKNVVDEVLRILGS